MTINFRKALILVFISGSLWVLACSNKQDSSGNKEVTQTTGQKTQQTVVAPEDSTVKYKVTFIELGSVRCIPCQQMQPIMKAIKEKFAGQVNVIFYDVWTPEGKKYADIYQIQVIPVQVFLDENGSEFFRHEGFFPQEEIEKILKSKGVN